MRARRESFCSWERAPLISLQPAARPFRHPAGQLRLDVMMNADNIGILQQQSLAHVLNRIHCVDWRAIKVDTEPQRVKQENDLVDRRNPLYVEETSIIAQIGLVEDEDRRGDDRGPESALVADRRLRDVRRAYDFIGQAVDLLLFVPGAVGIEFDVEGRG